MRIVATLLLLPSFAFAADPLPWQNFKTQEIDTGLKVGYAVVTADVDGDGKLDIVVVDQHKIVWYQNPTWKKRVMLDGKTKPDNVCITAIDIDGDKLPEFVIGAAWKPFDTKTPGTLQWIKRGKTLDDEWTMHSIPCDEPTVHRVRAIDIDGDGKPEIVHVPLMGRDATKEKNWLDGRPVRIMAYKIPANPEKPENWKPMVLSEELHVCHNFDALPGGRSFAVVSYEGVHNVYRNVDSQPWRTERRHEANQLNPQGSRGASEVKITTKTNLNLGHKQYATIEPWHGNQVVVYFDGKGLDRTVIDEQLRWGHGVAWADLDGDGVDELVIGVRDNPTKEDKFTEQRGVRIYKYNPKTIKWERFILENGGVAVEDLTVADLDGDGKPDIIAVGRATGNCRIYWNKRK